MTLGHGNGINHLVELKDTVDRHGLLKVIPGPVDLVLDGSTVKLDLHHVGLEIRD
jgi:hypothetical protein